MAKEYKHAGLIILILAVLAVAGALIGVIKSLPLLIIFTMIPMAVYEAYRTEGFFTKILSVAIVAGLVVEIIIILGKFNFTTAKIVDFASKKTAKYQAVLKNLPVPNKQLNTLSLWDMRIIAPALLVILALLLLKRTGGIYTRILAVLIVICSAALLVTVKPELLQLLFG